ncbi:hypothetical protein BT96DRAFT_939751 [Gymnopus androsaceus JB14]|uniref:Uncharacterized protein n=1 Tax=Gymnopus androsaceus JB14 TaxID=1447944 RepID=A0A6A4HLQ1_9AGAR|nr:hypothetical protein BT96DRAFT_939751 [Gymnopus androsaceus JB14]
MAILAIRTADNILKTTEKTLAISFKSIRLWNILMRFGQGSEETVHKVEYIIKDLSGKTLGLFSALCQQHLTTLKCVNDYPFGCWLMVVIFHGLKSIEPNDRMGSISVRKAGRGAGIPRIELDNGSGGSSGVAFQVRNYPLQLLYELKPE